MPKKRIITDAPESNAGDDFHVLWSVRKCLELINFNEKGLKAITLENGIFKDANELDPDGNLMLGVDLGEYFGGEDFGTANALVFSQLKYSTRHSTSNWTISSICQGKKTKHAGSIIERLAGIFTAHLNTYSRSEIITKLSLKLVSNRPFAASDLTIVNACQVLLEKHPSGLALTKLKAGVDKSFQDDITRLQAASGLTAANFTDFLRLLDFSDCGTGARHIIKEDAINAIARINSIESTRNYDTLHVKVWNKMMPESREDNKLTLIDILKAFNISTTEQLLPVPAKLDMAAKLVGREQSKDIVTEVIAADNKNICLHGGAGFGKSSIVRLIADGLPEGSRSLIFDCYGAGSYLDPIDHRHKPQWALMQLSNELAIEVGSPFMLLPPNLPAEYYLREFVTRLKTAGEIMRLVNPEALLLIIIDAADNSVTAAMNAGERSFVNDLVNTKMPTGVRLLVTTRTHRMPMLELPATALPIELLPFTLPETTSRIEPLFPGITSEGISAFHQLTNGIPRVQTYALVNRHLGIEALLEPLKPGGKTVDDIIQQNLEFVKLKLGDRTLVDNVLSFLITLPRPIPIALLSRLSGAAEAVILDMVTDIDQGIIYRDHTLMFSDENFETYLGIIYPETKEILTAIVAELVKAADHDGYASKNLGNFLLRTGRYAELKEIVFSQKHLIFPKDPVILKEIAVKRTRQAMKLSLNEADLVDFLKLQIIAAEAAKTNDKLTETLLANADLTALYGDRQTVENLYFKSNKLSWYGPVHFRCAAIYARKPEMRRDALAHLKAAESWLDWRDRSRLHHSRAYEMKILDWAFAGEAFCRLHNLEKALDWLWRHCFTIYPQVTAILLQNLLNSAPADVVDQALLKQKWSIRGKINVIPVYFRSGRQVPFETSSLINDILLAAKGRKLFKKRTKRQLVLVAEYLACHGNDSAQIAELLSYTVLPNPKSFPRFYSDDTNTKEFIELDTIFRSLSLEAVLSDKPLKIEALYAPIFLKGADEKKKGGFSDYESQEKARLDVLYRPMLPLYVLRAKFLCNKINEEALMSGIEGQMASFERDYHVYSYHRELRYYKTHYVRVFSDLLAFVEDKDRFATILIAGFAKKDNDIAARLAIAEQCSHCKAAHSVALNLLSEADKLIFDSETDAGGKISDFLRCVRIGGRLDQSVGLAYFKKMVDTVSEMDIEGFDQIRFISKLATRNISRRPRAAYELSRFTEYAHSRLKGWDGFPWAEAITGISRLDHYASIAALCRWDHLRFVRFGNLVLLAIQEAMIKGVITRDLAAGLLTFNAGFGDTFEKHLSLIFTGLDNPNTANLMGRLIFKSIVYDCPRYLQITLVTHLSTLLAETGFTDKNLKSEMTRFITFWKSFDEQAERRCDPVKRKSIVLKDQINPGDFSSVKALLEHYEAINDGTGATEVLEAIRKTCAIGQYLDFLDLLVILDSTHVSYYERKTLLEGTLELWRAHPAIAEWKVQNFEKFVHGAFPGYLQHEDLMNTPDLDEIARIFGANEKDLGIAVKKVLPLFIDSLNAREIYQLVKYTMAGLNESNSVEVIEWALGRWNDKIPAKALGTQWSDALCLPDNPVQVIGGAFRYLLGHPRKVVRWEAAHALRLIASCGNTNLLIFLLSEQDNRSCSPFQHEPYTYFWISAKLWLWMLLAKLARDIPGAVETLAPFGPKLLRDQNLPHVLIYNLAQQFCLALEEIKPGTFEVTESVFIQDFLKPGGRNLIAKHRVKPKAKKEEKLTFRFDTTDTVPYWYQPLCTVFNVSYQTIPTMADEVISKDWDYRGDVYKEDHVSSDDDDYSSTSNGHGAIPAVENLRKYYEFHAMFCVAFKLLRTARTDRAIPFTEWVNHWVSTYDGRWLADLRDFTPLEKVFGTDHRGDEWHRTLTDEWLLTWMQFDSGKPVVMADIKLYYGEDYESVNIDSALVIAQKGESLMRALQTMPFHRYRLPEADEEHHEIDEGDFQLFGWLNRISGRYEVFDRLDANANNIKQSYIYPGGHFEGLHPELSASDDFRLTLNKGAIIGYYENWDGTENYKDYHKVTSEGQRYRMDASAILKFLKQSGYSMILECQVNRRFGHDRYDIEDRVKNDKKNIYLIESDGTVKTISGNFKIRK